MPASPFLSAEKDSPLVSVIIPFLNGERYIAEAVDSVFQQTYRNWELLLVDDGSTDGSSAFARELANAHPGRVVYLEHVNHQNRGLSASRNLGIRHASGEFFAPLDCDDLWLPQKLERQIAVLLEHPEAAMVFGAPEYWRSWSGSGQETADFVPDLGVQGNTLFRPPELLCALYPLGSGSAPCPSDLMFRRRVLETAGFFQEEFRGIYGLYEDQAFLARVYANEPVFIRNETWTRYRLHADSCMASVTAGGGYSEVRGYFLQYLDRYLRRQGTTDVRVWTLLLKALRQYGRSIQIEGLRGADLRELKWQLRVAGNCQARLKLPAADPQSVRVEVATRGRDPWDIQLNQVDLKARAGEQYRITFRGRADRPAPAGVGFSRAHGDWGTLGLYRSIELSPDWQEYSFEFTGTTDDSNARIHFDLAATPSVIELSSIIMHRLSDGAPVEPDFIVHGIYPGERMVDSRMDRTDPTPGNAPRFSIVIPTYQRRSLVLHTVQSLEAQDHDFDFEVIVVVDGSTDGTAEALRASKTRFSLTVIEQPNQGASTARNAGAKAEGEILLFLDDDMEAHPRLLAEHDHSHHCGADVVSGHTPLHPKSPPGLLRTVIREWAEERARLMSQPGYELRFDDLLSGQISVKREAFAAVAGFDADFTEGGSYGHEDMDLGYRLLGSGAKAAFNPYALSYQTYVVTPKHHLRQIRQAGRASVAFARKHPEQAAAILSHHSRGRSTRPEIWRAVAALRPLTSPVTAAIRTAALRRAEKHPDDPQARKLFFEAFEMAYWQGVREGGGLPKLPAVRVLAYHAIRDLAGSPVMEPYGIPPAQFRGQMKLLKRLGFNFLDLDHFLRFQETGASVPPRSVLVTFDDAYQDFLDGAMPVLGELRIPAILFAVSGKLGGRNDWEKGSGKTTLPLLSASQLQQLAKRGIEIGCHSRTHPRLPEIAPSDLHSEIESALTDLVDVGLPRPRVMAYPYGESTPLVRRLARGAGLRAGFGVEYGCARHGLDVFQIPRIEILRAESGRKFLWKVLAAI